MWEVYNNKTGDTAGVEGGRRDCLAWIAQVKAGTSIRIHWKARKKVG